MRGSASFYFAKPTPAEEIARLLQADKG